MGTAVAPPFTARPRGLFTSGWEVREGDALRAVVHLSSWRERARLELVDDAETLEMSREGVASGAFRLLRDGQPIVQARKPSAWRSAFVIEMEGATLHLRPDSCFHSGFTLYAGAQAVGRIQRTGTFRRSATIDLPTDWPLPLRMFVFWLVLVIWSRDASAAASSFPG